MNQQLTTPLAFIIFKRPEATQRVFNEIKKVRPEKLFVVADGPRNEEEKSQCQAARNIIEQVDWDCEVDKNYAENNLGCCQRVSSGLDWVFENVKEAIILEDDCLPEPSFFYFCQELLKKYENNKQIMQIAGTNTQQANKDFQCLESYYFSEIAQIWGWATWAQAWQLVDVELKNWPEIKKTGGLKKLLPNYAVREYWEYLLDEIYQNKNPQKKPWAAQWFLTVLLNQGLSIAPKINLISNIGFGQQGTQAKLINDEKANLPIYAIEFPLKDPKNITVNKQADDYTFKFVFGINNTWQKKIKSLVRHYLPGPYYFLKKITKLKV